MTHEYLNLQYALVQLYLSKMHNRGIIQSLCQQMNSLLQKHAVRSISRGDESEESFHSTGSLDIYEEEQEEYQKVLRGSQRMVEEIDHG